MFAVSRALAALRIAAPARIQLAPRVVQRVRPFSFGVRALAPPKATATATATKKPASPRKTTATKAKPAAKAKAATKSSTAKKAKPKAKPKPKPKKAVVKKPARVKKAVLPKVPVPKIPKRGVSAYALFTKDHFKEVKQSLIDQGQPSTVVDVGRAGALAWKDLSEAEKQVYIDRSRQSHDEATARKIEWVRNLSPEELKSVNKVRKAKGKVTIKTPKVPGEISRTTPFFLYMADARAIPSNFDHTLRGRACQMDFSRRSGAKWKTMTEAEKAPYFERADKHNAAVRASKAA